MTDFLQLTISFRKFPRQHDGALQLAFCMSELIFTFLCGQQHQKCERAIRLLYPPFICKLHSSAEQKSSEIQTFRDSNSCSSVAILN